MGGGKRAVHLCVWLALSLSHTTAAQTSDGVELAANAVAETPASAEAPSEGQGPSIIGQVLCANYNQDGR